MTAKDTKDLADRKKHEDLDKILDKIKLAAERGDYGIEVNTINIIVKDSLEELGYIVTYFYGGPRVDDSSYYTICW
jgi:hypothetical protein